MVIPGGAIATVGGSALSGLFGSKKSKGASLQDLRTPEQKAAAQELMQLAQIGSYGGINLGEQYQGALGNYDMTGGELQNLVNLQDLYGGKTMSGVEDYYTGLMNEKFDPSDPSTGYAAFQRQLARSGAEASDVLNREAAITGNRFGTAILGEKADLASRMQDQSAQYLANLYQQNQSNRLAGAGGLQNVITQKAGLSESIAQQAAVERALKDQQAKDALNEYKRQRAEQLARIDLLSQEADRNPYLGVSSIPGESAFSGLVSSLMSSLGGQVPGAIGQIGGWLGDMFGGGKSQSQILGFNTANYR